MYSKIKEFISEIQQEHNVRVLLACENSSRAWGYASPTSDYDVFFVYVQNDLKNYLGLTGYRETIEKSYNVDGFDISIRGWNIRKAVDLAKKSNAMLAELVGVAYTQRDKAYVDDNNLRMMLSDYMKDHYSPYTLAKSYSSTVYHHLVYDYYRHEGDRKKQLKSLLAGFRNYLIVEDYHKNGIENILLNTSLDLNKCAKLFDEEHGTDFVRHLRVRLTHDPRITFINDSQKALVKKDSELKQLIDNTMEKTYNISTDKLNNILFYYYKI